MFSSVKKNIIYKTVGGGNAGRIVAYTMFGRFYIIYGACTVTIYINKAAAEGLSYVSVSTSNGNTPHIPHLNRPVFACSFFPSGEFELFKHYDWLIYSTLLQRLLQIQAPGLQSIILFWTFFYFL